MAKFTGFTNIPRKSIKVDYSALSNDFAMVTTGYTADVIATIYSGDTVIATGSLADSTATGIADGIIAIFTNQDSAFAGFDENGQYSIVIDGETQSMYYSALFSSITNFSTEELWVLVYTNEGETHSATVNPKTISVSQTKITTKKKYDTKLLSEDLLPKTVAKKSDVAAVKIIANNALEEALENDKRINSAFDGISNASDAVETAQSTANSAKTIANEAKSTASSAQSTANEAKSTASSAQNTANNAISTANSAKATVANALTVSKNGAIRPPPLPMEWMRGVIKCSNLMGKIIIIRQSLLSLKTPAW